MKTGQVEEKLLAITLNIYKAYQYTFLMLNNKIQSSEF